MPGFLTEEQVHELRDAHRHLREKRLADRIKAVLALHRGVPSSEIARLLLLDDVTLRRYVKTYQEHGIDGLLECRYSGGASRLTALQEQELVAYLDTHVLLTAAQVAAYIRRTDHIHYSLEGVTKLLHRLGFVYKKPKLVPGKADPIKQKEFLELYRQVTVQLKPHDQVYFSDALHPTHNSHPACGWIRRGKTALLPANTGRQRLNLTGALNLTTKDVVILETETVNADAVIRLLEELARLHPVGTITLILDNARYHHAKKVTAWLKKHRRFKLLFLPSYSPNLNLIERLWRFLYQKILSNRYFPTFGAFRETILDFFSNLHRYRRPLSTLLTENFQIIPALELQT